ncbi:MAG: glutamate-1-semialdehyde 2,1-aminomutase [Acidobacteria bacterium]|uniref:Glutamate-1-semialdehyde 2,1-aminomutase n=1 Tax=Candidatus Polarisedimenticola svalbardensis TaxID=2886004 RepID=A0A8J6Y8Z9_9BACT|nr:glutamate-1-semialdehyde 2,1-aminomutase [Candidatus Polarisedimenticola svalbardensis]
MSMEKLFAEANRYIPGGVNSPVRAFGGVGGTPVFMERGSGTRVYDTDGKEYIDYLGSWGPLIAGHSHPRVVAAIREQAGKGSSFGAPCELETVLARRVCGLVPACEKVRFVSSGTEATMSAIRLARGATGRQGVVKVAGCYHGHVDSLLVSAGSGVLTLSLPGSPGVPDALAGLTHVIPYNDPDALEKLLVEKGGEIACIILEPVAGNMGVIPPAKGYLERVRELTREHGVLLILDEVMTGFRVHAGGAQTRFGIKPDLSCFGKVIGGGLPVGAFGGRADLMDQLAPTGPVYQAGTLSGNPLAMRAGIETLDILAEDGTYRRMEEVSAALESGLGQAAAAAGLTVTSNRVGSMMTLFFAAGPVVDFESATRSDTDLYAKYFHGMLQRGVYVAPSQFEAAFVSTLHGDAEVEATLEAARETFGEMT